MSNLLITLLGTVLATNQPVAISNLVAQTTGIHVDLPAADDPVELEYKKLVRDDDAVMEEIDRWISEANALEAAGGVISKATLNARIEQRLQALEKRYEDFLQRHPNHARARLAFGSFLSATRREPEALVQWEKAREIDPSNPAAWNNLANHYGHFGDVKKAFECYAKAIELNPLEPVYYQNFATTTYLFRKDAREHYGITEEEVFNRALALYRKAIQLDPTNLVLATDYAQSFYGIKPLRAEDAIDAWRYALELASNDVERQGIYTHLARVELNSGRFEEAQKHLDLVTLPMYESLKARLIRNLKEKRAKAAAASASELVKPKGGDAAEDK